MQTGEPSRACIPGVSRLALLRHMSAEAVSEDDCEHIVTLLVDKGQDSGREAGTLIQHALGAFDAGAVCALRLVPQLLQQPPSDYDAQVIILQDCSVLCP